MEAGVWVATGGSMERVAEWICEWCKQTVQKIDFSENQDEVEFMLRGMSCGTCGRWATLRIRRKGEDLEEET